MIQFPTPTVVVSKCLGYAPCRWDGETVADAAIVAGPDGGFLGRLARYARVVTVCPEVEIGLGTPRDKIRLVGQGHDQRLVQPATGRDLTATMDEFAARYLSALERDGVDGFILKSRSPSCGIHDTKFFADQETEDAAAHGSGLFARAVRQVYPGLPVEDEARLADTDVRRDFLERLFRNALERGTSGGEPADSFVPLDLL